MTGPTTNDDPSAYGSEGGLRDRSPTAPTDSLTRDDLFDVLQARRRRLALWYLHERAEGEARLRALARHVAALEADTDAHAVDGAVRQRVQLSLYQAHLPKLVDFGVVEYDETRERVELTPLADAFLPYLAAEPDPSAGV
ncbi:DUF7344 domain-containing protein [Salinirubrum litoreum]|uniref:DUF7344 domain-containing protein n=1 Tax=Salinirubrum litoreum TaxID=1126234 RepID=A0ABD5RFN4_9EURY|nr:hypothetical protein [Salinirubrum litoreum]